MKNQFQKQYYQAIIETPLGAMVAIANDTALCLLEFFDRKNIERQIKGVGITKMCDRKSAPIESIQTELELYFSGKLKKFKTPVCFMGTDFQQQVWQALQNIPFGETQAYLDIAQTIKKPTAFRAVANANAANRLAIIVPCHRVINHNGALGGYAGGLNRKIELLKYEGVYNEAF
jgi:AraC family transcriptional regulator of adaptative response/methylated-DNA-[protein]-cysteine methyltransferase